MKATREATVGRRLADASAERRAPSGGTRAAKLTKLAESAKTRVLPTLLHAAAGFLLAQGRVFGSATPFGVGFAAAFGAKGAEGIAAAAGAALGSIAAWRLGDGLKYFAACVLALVAAKAFADTRLAERRFFAPTVAAGSIAVVGFVFVAADGFGTAATAGYIAETALSALAALVLPCAVEQPRGEVGGREKNLRSAARLASAAIVLLSLASVPLLAGVTVGRTAAALLVLAAANGGGMGAGAAAGVAFGVIFDASSGGAFYTLTLGAAGLVSGVVSGGSRLLSTAAFALTASACALIDGGRFSALYETFVAATAFVVIPDGRLRFLDFLLPEESGSTVLVERRMLRERAKALGEVLGDAARALRTSRPASLTQDKVYLRTSARVCKGCALRALCWERERAATVENMRRALERVREKGGADIDDLPPAFRSRCMRAESFGEVLGEEYRVYQLERRRAASDERRRELAAMRCASASAMMSEASAELAAGLEWQGSVQAAARRTLASVGVSADVTAWRYPSGRLALEVAAPRLAANAVRALEQTLSVELHSPRPCGGGVLLLEYGRLEVRVGAATVRRRGSPANGDSGTYFETDDGRFYCVLSDGMGSGEEAAVESGRAVRAAERLLKAGVSPTRAAEQLSALAAERESANFATLDILEIDMQSGRAEITKLGGAASYVRSGGRAERVASEGEAPLGISAHASVLPIRAGAFECIVMATDGVVSDGRWVEELIEQADVEDGEPSELARAIASEAAHRTAEADDITVVAVFVE